MSTREVWEARRGLEEAERALRRDTGVLITRRDQAKARLDRAMAAQTRLQQEYDRLVFTLRDAFGMQLGQQTLVQALREGPRTTFIVKTSQTGLRKRIRELRLKLHEAPD